MSDLPSREETLVAISRWVHREPEVAYDLHSDLRLILDVARGWSSGRLIDGGSIDPCPGDDPTCPGHDHGDPCHYRGIAGADDALQIGDSNE